MVPEPLHAALIHLPIVALIAGMAYALVSAFTERAGAPLHSAIFLGLGALGAQAAYFSGEAAAEQMNFVTAEMQEVVALHDYVSGLVKWGSLAAFVAALPGVLLIAKKPLLARGLRFGAAFFALVTLVPLVYTSHLGGRLSHEFNYGPQAFAEQPPAEMLQPLELED